MSNSSIENPEVGGSPTNKAMVCGVTAKTSSSFSERVENTLEISFRLPWEQALAMK